MDNSFLQGLFQMENPLIQLYIIKMTLEDKLIREIQINSFLQNSAKMAPPVQCKVQHIPDSENSQSSTNGKVRTSVLRPRKKINIGKIKNDTKNIPKNFGKAIITFVQQKDHIVRRFLAHENVVYEDFYAALKEKKRGINSIADLRNLWLEEHFVYARQMRMVSLYFLKRGSLTYVFSSRISNHEGHIKYRNRLIEVLRVPQDFTSIKTP